MLPKWLSICMIGAACGFLFGLLIQSNREEIAKSRSGAPTGFALFGRNSVPQLLASGLANGIISVGLFLGPSAILLNVFQRTPLCGYEYHQWLFSLFAGIAIGKFIRWSHWKKTQDFE